MTNESTMKRREFLKAAGLGAAALALPGCAALSGLWRDKEPPKRQNVVVILCDDLGYGDLGCYGHRHIQTPNLDRLATDGMQFIDCYAAAPVCSPSRAGMLTGRTPHRCGVYDWIPLDNPMHLKAEEVTVATLLKNAGYATCHVGKWHCNGYFNSSEQPQPDDHGFEYWFATQNNASPSHHNPVNFVRNGRAAGKLEGYSSELIVDEGINWLKHRRDREKPFCLFVWFHAPHEPIATGEEFMKLYAGRKEAVYYGNVSQMDHACGRLMDTLDELQLTEETFVMFTSDNGPETLNRYRNAFRSYGSPGPLRGMKLHMYEGGIGVPGIIRWPGRVEAGTVSHEPVNGTDLLPTLCALAGVAVPTDRPIDGASILPVFEGRSVERAVPLYWRYDRALSKPYTVAMRQGYWKLLADSSLTQFELYNLRGDRTEKKNLVLSEAGRLEAMKQTLAKLHHEIDAEGPQWQKGENTK